jgi:RNA polymerase sigma-70 factor (ECF subfamily)
MTRAESLADLAHRFEERTWHCPDGAPVPGQDEMLAECRRAEVRLEEVLAEQLDETLALAVQNQFFLNAAFVELFTRRYEDRLLRWLSSLDRDEHRRRDVVQMLYLAQYQNRLRGFKPQLVFRTWLRVVARNFWIAQVARRQWPQTRSKWDERDKIDQVERDVLARELESLVPVALARLPPQQREPMRLTLDGHSPQDIAQQLGLEVNQVYRRLHLARRQLVALLDLAVPPSGSGRKPKGAGPEPPAYPSIP